MQKDTHNNLKDTGSTLGITLKDNLAPVSYDKTNKLITALYMVTDIMDREEPIRNKLRTLGTGIISDMQYLPANALLKISEIMSFLDIAGVVNLVSEMNLGILRKEFFELKKAIDDSIEKARPSYSEVDLADLFNDSFSLPSASFATEKKDASISAGSTRIGVQRGSTLLKALHGYQMSDKNKMSDKSAPKTNIDFDVLKKKRRDDIIHAIKSMPNGATITDIRSKAGSTLASSSEKTLQRELIGMLKDGVLKKTGEKRWSRYFLP